MSRECIPTSTFSSAVICGKSRMFWNVRPIPSFVIVCGGLPVTSVPSNTIWPEVGLYTPVSMLKNVVLPAPFGPIRLTIDRTGNGEVEIGDGDQPAELFADVLDGEEVVSHPRP